MAGHDSDIWLVCYCFSEHFKFTDMRSNSDKNIRTTQTVNTNTQDIIRLKLGAVYLIKDLELTNADEACVLMVRSSGLASALACNFLYFLLSLYLFATHTRKLITANVVKDLSVR